MRKSRSGMPWAEILIGAILAGIVLGVLGNSILAVLELAEKTLVESAVLNMRSGLRMEKARRIAAGKGLRDLAERNPLSFLSDGDAEQAPWLGLSRQLKPIQWVADTQAPVLAYQPKRSRYLKILSGSADNTLVWRTSAHAADGSDVEIVLLTPYSWF